MLLILVYESWLLNVKLVEWVSVVQVLFNNNNNNKSSSNNLHAAFHIIINRCCGCGFGKMQLLHEIKEKFLVVHIFNKLQTSVRARLVVS